MDCHIDICICKLSLLSTMPVMLALVQENAEAGPVAANCNLMMMPFMARSVVSVIAGYFGYFIGMHTTYFISTAARLSGIPIIFLFSGKKTV